MKAKQISVMISLSLSLLALSGCKPETPPAETRTTADASDAPAEGAADASPPGRP
mgnify:CR=1 FL=1